MNKNDELIMCLSKEQLFLNGSPSAIEIERATTCPGIAVMRKRGEVETDTSLLQPIPYAVIIAPFGEEKEARTLVYKRSAAGGETRLQDKYSVGVGGHINAFDIAHYFVDTEEKSPCSACLLREVTEELGVKELKCEAILMDPKPIYDDSEAVSSVHIGLNYTLILSEVPTIEAEDALASVEWIPVASLVPGNEIYDKLEGWSKIVITSIVDSLSAK